MAEEKREGWFSRFKRMSKIKKAIAAAATLLALYSLGYVELKGLDAIKESAVKINKSRANMMDSYLNKIRLELEDYKKTQNPKKLEDIKKDLKFLNSIWDSMRGGQGKLTFPIPENREEMDKSLKELNAAVLQL